MFTFLEASRERYIRMLFRQGFEVDMESSLTANREKGGSLESLVSHKTAGEYLRCGDTRRAQEILPELQSAVTLAVTSPPYHNAISYEGHVANPEANYRPRHTISYSGEYLPLLRDAWAACHRLLRPGGYLAINVGTVLLEGYQFPVPQDITSQIIHAEEPWEYFGTITWNKVTAGVKRAGSVIRWGLPGYWYPNILTEAILVFRKPGPMLPKGDAPAEFWLPVWDLAPVPPRQIPHPAPFPEDLPHRLIRMLTGEGDVVYDPFLGAGSTAKAAVDLRRVPAGIDLEPAYVEFSKSRLQDACRVRPQQLSIRVVSPSQFVPKRKRQGERTRHGSGLRRRP